MEVLEAALDTLCLVLKSSVEDATYSVLSADESQEIACILVQLDCCKEQIYWLFYLLSCIADCDEIFAGKPVDELNLVHLFKLFFVKNSF